MYIRSNIERRELSKYAEINWKKRTFEIMEYLLQVV